MTTFFTSDLHASHKFLATGIRGFSSVEEHDKVLINNWNEDVSKEDTVYVLGDILMPRNRGKLDEIFSQLNGTKFLVRGNHDRHLSDAKLAPYFQSVSDNLQITLDTSKGPRGVVLYHYPCITWNGSFHGSWLLCGHTHGMLPQSLPTYWQAGLQLDVGLDVWGMKPVSAAEVERVMLWKENEIWAKGGTLFGDYRNPLWPKGPLEEARKWSAGERDLP